MATKTFSYEALDASGALVKGKIDSESSDAAATALANQRLVPMSIAGAGTGLQKEIKLPGFRGGTSLKDLAIFARQFASMTSSGLTLLRSLAILEEQTSKPKLREAITQVKLEVQGGATLSSSMAQHPDHFPPLMVNMIKAGETGGFLDDALARIARMYEADANLRQKIKSAMTYPVIVLIFSLLMGTGVILFIVPIFEKMFKNLGGKLPLPTQILVTLSHNMLWILPVVLIGTFAGFRAFRKAVQTNASFRLKVDRFKLRLPVFGALFTKLAISRWARNLGTLLAVGVPIIQALDVVGGTSGSAVINEAMIEVRDSVRLGGQMSAPLAKHPLFPSMVVQMIEVGEETGQITDMLDKVADYYDREVETATEALTSALEPLLVVLLGAVIGVMVICLYMPMFSIYQHIQSN
ncbi:type II secretion system F family protein [Jatrophihabitans cynanchi]|jgi:type IV pilus assembly protein PilC|uniref:Type II secretion system F family protein n=1 Tax=Jatrophihabitans cynanchi TaxID=2944128 RepID=A0ABY7K1D7_9ACTN|nr:type II secretion system F family protein [Jatrophihabitans sp. SB3-54]WAX58661.1 type II secretion system F family protein [Jatrophihabitans sp. SB3-54]